MTASAQRKADILNEAADLFADRGFAAVGVSDIGERVGITGGAIYRHFENKNAVLQALLLDTVEAWLVAADRAAQSSGDDRIQRMVDSALELVTTRPGELVTFMRERHRADEVTTAVLTAGERKLAAEWRTAMLDARPDLTKRDDELRQRALHGVLLSLARRPDELAQRRFRGLVADGLAALATAPPSHFVDTAPSAWAGPTSRRQEILAAAAALFRRRGYHGVGIDEIGEVAGISGPAVYDHFGEKADILVDLYDLAGALVVAGNHHALRGAPSPEKSLTRLIRSIVDITFGWVDLMIVTGQEGRSLPESHRARLARRRHEIYDTWITVVRALRPDIPPSAAKALVVAILPMVGQIALRARPEVLSVDATVDVVRAFLLGSERASSKEKR